jgi:beta-xylosidase
VPSASKTVSFAVPLSVLAYTGITSELVREPDPVEVIVGSSSSEIKSSTTLNVNGKTRLIKVEERAFLSAATVGPAGVTRGDVFWARAGRVLFGSCKERR